MSYILDALRRLEQDKEKMKRGANPMEAVLIPDMDEADEPGRRPFLWMGVGAVLLLLAVATTYWITRQALAPPGEGAAEATARHLPSATSGGDLPESASFSETESPSQRNHASRSSAPVPSSNRVRASRPDILTSPAAREGSVETMEPSSATRVEGTGRAGNSIDRPLAPARRERAALSDPLSEGESYPEWAGPEIKINAIAYSHNENSRFAVVNLKTVHEGDNIEGLAVVEIQEDAIVFEESGTRYKVSVGKR